MPIFQPGLVHTPVTPFSRDHRIDFDVYGKLIEFHLRNGADALALPMHAGESVSLTEAERRTLVEFAIKQVRGRVPVVAHVSDAGTGIAAALARHAEAAGAAAIVATTPYYWTPPPAMVLEHFVQIGTAVSIPFLVYNAPEEMAGTKLTAELALKLMDQAANFAGRGGFEPRLAIHGGAGRPRAATPSGVPVAVGGRIHGLGRGHRRKGGILAARRDRARAGARTIRSLPQRPAVRGAQGPGGDRGAAAACEKSRSSEPQSGTARNGARLRRGPPAAAARGRGRVTARSRNGWAPWPRCAPSRVDGEIQR